MERLQSLSMTVRRSSTSPFTSPAQAILARPSLMSVAISMMDFGSEYSLVLPSFSVMIICFTSFFVYFSQTCFRIFILFTATKKSLLTRLCCQKGRCISFTAVPPILFFQTTSFDDNGITGPDWGRSELVFDHVPVKTLAPQNGVSLCHIHCDLLVSSTLCFLCSVLFGSR